MVKTFTNMNLFNGIDNKIIANSYLTVNDQGKIIAIGTGLPNDNSEQIDLHGKFVMPGMINVHTHIMMDPFMDKFTFASETEVTFEALKNLKTLLNSGVTYIRDCGCAFQTDIKLRRMQLQNMLPKNSFPDIMPSGRPMTITGGHADFIEGVNGETTWGHIVNSEDDMRKAVREEFKLGAKNIKVMATGGVMSANDQVDDTELSEAEIAVAVQEAHSKHMTVASHSEGNKGIQNSLEAGVDSIEHGVGLDEEQAKFMSENNVFLVPTLSAAVNMDTFGKGKIPDYMYEKNKILRHSLFDEAAMAMKKGVKIAVGTDAGTPFNSFETGTADEVALITELGATPYQALLGTTQYAAELMGITDHYGSLGLDKYADFLVLDENPLENVEAIKQKDKQVYKNGVLVNATKNSLEKVVE